jgi:hypothetical protein
MLRSLAFAAAFAAGIATAAGALAQLRTLPANAKRGTLSHVQGMVMELNGQRIELAAGAQIRDANNMVVLPTALPAGSRVKFQTGPDGKLNRAWILTPQEAAQPDLAR